MKRILICVIAVLLVLTLCACGQKAPAEAELVDLSALFDKMLEVYPEMMALDEEMRFNFLGVRSEDCLQCVTLICDDGMKADELWLLEATDDEAMERLTKLAERRLEIKAEETESYNPAQYEIVQKGKVLTSGHYLALIVTPEVEKAEKLFNEAMG